MDFELSIAIETAGIFAFLRDKDSYVVKPGSPVLVVDKTTAGLAGVGTRLIRR